MLRFWISILLCVNFLFSCEISNFINFEKIGIKIEPESNETILDDIFSPVIIKFDTEMEKKDIEGIFQINSYLGVTRGDKFWIDNDLYFVPVSGWTIGVRYNLSLLGTIRSADGREMRVDHYVTFYAVNRNDPPLLEWFYPSNNMSIGVNDIVFQFKFSNSMNRFSVESALTIEAIGNKTFEWADNDSLLKVIPEKPLSPWNLYRWNIKDSAKCSDGVPIPKIYNGFFITDLDQTLPIIKNVYPVLFDDGCWYPTGADIETGLDTGQGMAIEFSKPMGETALRSVRFEPSLSGRTEMLSENSVVFIFSRDPEPEIVYTLIVSGETRDTEGLKLGADYKLNFSVNIPFLNIFSLTFNDSKVIDSFSYNVIPIDVSPAVGELSVSIYFSLPFGNEDKRNVSQKISLVPFFPGTLAPVALQYVNWISDDRLYLRWEGVGTAGIDSEIPHYYKITIPGGNSGVSNGYYMKNDIVFFLEVIR